MTTSLQKPPIDRSRKFNGAEKEYIIKSLAHFIPVEEIRVNLQKEFGKTCSAVMIYTYKHNPEFRELLNKERQAFLSEIAEVPGAHKRVRLDRGERIYNYAVEHKDMQTALSALRYQKDELEEKLGGGNVLVLQLNQFNQMTDAEIEERRSMLLDRIRTLDNKKVERLEFKGEEHGNGNESVA